MVSLLNVSLIMFKTLFDYFGITCLTHNHQKTNNLGHKPKFWVIMKLVFTIRNYMLIQFCMFCGYAVFLFCSLLKLVKHRMKYPLMCIRLNIIIKSFALIFEHIIKHTLIMNMLLFYNTNKVIISHICAIIMHSLRRVY